MRLRKQIEQTHEEIERAKADLDAAQQRTSGALQALAAAESRQPIVESLVGFLVGRREQNGFGEAYRIVVPRSDVTERHA
jgi:hypothetical protein